MPKSKSFSTIQKNAMQDVEQTRKIADELKKQLDSDAPLGVPENLSSNRPIKISTNRRVIKGQPIMRKDKSVRQLSEATQYEKIIEANASMKNLSDFNLNLPQKSVRVLSSMGTAMSVSVNSSAAKQLDRVATKEVNPDNNLKIIELDESIADQEYKKRTADLRFTTTNHKIATFKPSKRQYVAKIASRMSHLYNTGTTGFPNVYSNYRPHIITSETQLKSTAVGKKIIGSPIAKIAATSQKTTRRMALSSMGGTGTGAPMGGTGTGAPITTQPTAITSATVNPMTSGNTTY
jgi:hypothetical protein